MENVQKMEFITDEIEYSEMAKLAKKIDVKYVGVKKKDVVTEINKKIEQINNGEAHVEEETIQQPENEINENITEENNETTEESNEVESPAKAAAKKSAEQQKERNVRRSSKKWYEEEGAFKYNEGDIVTIIGGKDLIGRKLCVVGPSNKQNALKGRLIHPVTGEMQKTVISITFDRLEMETPAAEAINNETEEQIEEQIENQIEEQNENQTIPENDITADSEEEVMIPEIEEEEKEKEAL